MYFLYYIHIKTRLQSFEVLKVIKENTLKVENFAGTKFPKNREISVFRGY